MLRTVLVANRGEIAVRILRTCREMGIRTVVAHSTVDRDSAAVRLADEAVQVGDGPARGSYLNAAAILEAAAKTGAEAIHPGYGFLSENAEFAEACEAHGIRFVGPPAEVTARFGDKVAARAAAARAGVPTLPGSAVPHCDAAEVRDAAAELGYPLIVKAVSGGGGRGMCVVREPHELLGAYVRTRADADAFFGDPRVYLERYVESGRHVEVQILADAHGHAVHLGARDCSVQRRRQKLVEETPPPGLPASLVAEMGESSARCARRSGLVGAATVEFVLAPDGRYHFLEVNGRLQVEHPVTEAVTGVDLVRQQLLIASGEPLALAQEDVAPQGVAIECRVNAEDPARGFVPTAGLVEEFLPPSGPWTRTDTHGYPGMRVTPYYDSLLAKVIVWAPDRAQAIARMDRSLAEFRVRGPGIVTTIDFTREVLRHPAFRAGRHTTGLVDELMEPR